MRTLEAVYHKRRKLVIQSPDGILLRIEAVSRIQMEANFGAVAVVNTTVQLRLPVAAGTADKDHAGFLEIVVDLSSQCCPHRSLHIEIFLQRIQIRDVAFQRRDGSVRPLRQRLDQFFEVHACRSYPHANVC